MRLSRALLALAFLICASSLEAQQPPPSTDPWTQEKNGFAAMLVLSRHPERFLAEWNEPARAGYTPEVERVVEAVREEPVTAFVLFSGCQAREDGLCWAEVDFKVLRPDGSVFGDLPDRELWRGKEPLPADAMGVGVEPITIRVEDGDPLGEYRLEARVCDRAAAICLDLAQPLEAMEPADALDLSDFMQSYYRDPRPTLVEAALRALDESGVLARSEAKPPALAFYGLIFSQHPDRVEGWRTVVASLSDEARPVLETSLSLAATPGSLVNNAPPSPSHNDMLWGAFYASGEPIFLHALIRRLEHLGQRQDLELFMTASSAQWALADNARRHPKVAEVLQNAQEGQTPKIKKAIEEALTLDPNTLSQRIQTIVQEQKEAGIWK